MPHHIPVDLSEHPVQDPVFAPVDDECHRHGAQGDEPDELLRRPAGALQPLLAQVLPGHHGAACSEGGKHVDEQHHDVVHQGDTGDGRLPTLATMMLSAMPTRTARACSMIRGTISAVSARLSNRYSFVFAFNVLPAFSYSIEGTAGCFACTWKVSTISSSLPL